MIDLGIEVRGIEEVQTFLGKIPAALRARLVSAMTSSMTELGAAVRAGVPVASGKARASVRVEVLERPTLVRGRVFAEGGTGSHGYLLRFFEKGVDRTVHVRGYVRRARSGDVHALGKRGQPLKRRFTHVGVGQVAGYDRMAHVAQLRPFGSAYDMLRGRIEQRLSGAVESLAAEAA